MTVQILVGDCRARLAELQAGSVNTCVTSPPYFGLRDYGHAGQIGLEPTPDEFVAAMVSVFREVRRVLRDDGTLWLNLGDSYAGSWGAQSRGNTTGEGKATISGKSMLSARQIEAHPRGQTGTGSLKNTPGLKNKDLIGIPWRVALALQADGWYLRQDIIWHKPNPMPESVTDRCTKAHEYVFLLSKGPRYYFDSDAIAERAEKSDAGSTFDGGKTALHQGQRMAVGDRPQARRARELAEKHGLTDAHIAAIRSAGVSDAGKALTTTNGAGKNADEVTQLAAEAKAALGGYYREFLIPDKRNKRSVWTVATQPFKEAHFATYPPDLIEPCILAGAPKGGLVLDPFGGAGTTGLVADRLRRDCTLIELNPEYAEMAQRRITSDGGMFTRVEVITGPLLTGQAGEAA